MNQTLLQLLEASSSSAESTNSVWSIVVTIAPFALLILVFWFFMLRPQKKQQKEADAMRNNVGRGDVIVTVGGIVGIVLVVKDEDVLLETSSDKSRVQIKKWAIKSVEKKAN